MELNKSSICSFTWGYVFGKVFWDKSGKFFQEVLDTVKSFVSSGKGCNIIQSNQYSLQNTVAPAS